MRLSRAVQSVVGASWARSRNQKRNAVLEDSDMDAEAQAHRPLLKVDVPNQDQGPSASYGATERPRISPESHRRSSVLGRVPEEDNVDETGDAVPEEPEEVEWELEAQDLYSGSYRRVVALYTFVPLSSLLVLVLLALLPGWIWPHHHSKPRPHSPYFPSPIPELLVSSAMWSLSHLVRVPLHSVLSTIFQSLHPVIVAILFQAVYSLVYNSLRVASIPILRLRTTMNFTLPTWRDEAFRRVWWLAIGWAATETIVAIVQEYQQIALYKDVMVPEDQVDEVLAQPGSGSRSRFGSSQEEVLVLSPRSTEEFPPLQRQESGATDVTRELSEAIELEVDRDIERLVSLKEREELEEIYGLPIIRIPVFLSCLQRIDSIIITLGITLILSASYLSSQISISISAQSPSLSSNQPFIVAFPLILLLNTFLSLLYTPLILPRIGFHTSAYIGFLVGLGCLFTGLGLWRALS